MYPSKILLNFKHFTVQIMFLVEAEINAIDGCMDVWSINQISNLLYMSNLTEKFWNVKYLQKIHRICCNWQQSPRDAFYVTYPRFRRPGDHLVPKSHRKNKFLHFGISIFSVANCFGFHCVFVGLNYLENYSKPSATPQILMLESCQKYKCAFRIYWKMQLVRLTWKNGPNVPIKASLMLTDMDLYGCWKDGQI